MMTYLCDGLGLELGFDSMLSSLLFPSHVAFLFYLHTRNAMLRTLPLFLSLFSSHRGLRDALANRNLIESSMRS